MRLLGCLVLVLVPSLIACGPPAATQPIPEVPVNAPPPAETAAAGSPQDTSDPAPSVKPAAATTPKSGKGPEIAKLPNSTIRFEGGDGSAIEQAIVIKGAKGEGDGVASEYEYLRLLLGAKGAAWKMKGQSLLEHDGRQVDQLDIVLANGQPRSFYFDIGDFFGKF